MNFLEIALTVESRTRSMMGTAGQPGDDEPPAVGHHRGAHEIRHLPSVKCDPQNLEGDFPLEDMGPETGGGCQASEPGAVQ